MPRMPLLNLALLLMLFFSDDIMMTLKLREDHRNIFEDNCLCCSFIVLLCFKWHGYCCLDISLDCSDKPAYLQTTCQPKTMEAKCIFFSWKPGLEVSLGVGIKVVNAMHQVYHWSPHVCATEEEAPECINDIVDVCDIHNFSRISIFSKGHHVLEDVGDSLWSLLRVFTKWVHVDHLFYVSKAHSVHPRVWSNTYHDAIRIIGHHCSRWL